MYFSSCDQLSFDSPVSFMLTPTGRSMLATAWSWLKGVFGNIAASSPRGFPSSFAKNPVKATSSTFSFRLTTRQPSLDFSRVLGLPFLKSCQRRWGLVARQCLTCQLVPGLFSLFCRLHARHRSLSIRMNLNRDR
jgi:hypothetical protein